LRDELSDLRIENEITQEKLRIAEQTIERHHQRKTSQLLAGDSLRPRSPVSDTATSATNLSSPTTASTPPHTKTEMPPLDSTPPSPPLSEASINAKRAPVVTPMPVRKSSIALDSTPRPGLYQHQSRTTRHSRGPSLSMSTKSSTVGRNTPSIRTTAPGQNRSRPSTGASANAGGPPRSASLYHIRGLIGQMQKLEERVHSARSKLPAPTTTPPRASPRNGSGLGHHIPSTVTVRSTRKRPSGSSVNAAYESGVSRLSFGVSGARQPSSSRPSSRTSMSSQSLQRPASRSSTRTPLGHYSSASIGKMEGRLPRPRSSMSGQSGGHGHTQSMSMSTSSRDADADTLSDGSSAVTPVARRVSVSQTGIPTPSGLPRRQSAGRRTSLGMESDMGPPARPRKMSEIGETY
jgi:hypothetical protein